MDPNILPEAALSSHRRSRAPVIAAAEALLPAERRGRLKSVPSIPMLVVSPR